jgi:hypothetical protein
MIPDLSIRGEEVNDVKILNMIEWLPGETKKIAS